MKKILLSAVLLSSIGLNAQQEPAVKTENAVGIGTEQPRATLDVKGDARLQEVELMETSTPTTAVFSDCPCVLTIDQYGVIKRIPNSKFVMSDGTVNPDTGNGNNDSKGSGDKGGGDGTATLSLSSGNNLTLYVPSIKDGQIDEQGKIGNGNDKLNFNLFYTNGDGGSYNEVNYTITATGEKGAKELRIHIPAGRFDNNGGTITGTVEAVGNDALKVKQQSVPTSIEDYNNKVLHIATAKLKLGQVDFNLKIDGGSGIPDKHFDNTDHKFVYLPVIGPDGKTWLNNNLGADYANMNSNVFNPAQQATNTGDFYAYGSLFQFGRDADGHELMNWTGVRAGSSKYTDKSWKNTNELNYTKENDPCPNGYRTPSKVELENLRTIIGTNPNNESFASSSLAIPAASWKENPKDTTFGGGGRNANLWSKERFTGQTNSTAHNLHIGTTGSLITTYPVTRGLNIRCIKDN